MTSANVKTRTKSKPMLCVYYLGRQFDFSSGTRKIAFIINWTHRYCMLMLYSLINEAKILKSNRRVHMFTPAALLSSFSRPSPELVHHTTVPTHTHTHIHAPPSMPRHGHPLLPSRPSHSLNQHTYTSVYQIYKQNGPYKANCT